MKAKVFQDMQRFFFLWVLLFGGVIGMNHYGDEVVTPEDENGSRGDQAYDLGLAYGGDYTDYSGTTEDSTTEEDLYNRLYQYNDALVALFDSEEDVLQTMYHDLHNPSYLRLATVKFYLLQAKENPEKYSRLNATQRDEISQVIGILEQSMSGLFKNEEHKWFMETLVEQGKKLTLILPINLITEHLENLAKNIDNTLWTCQDGYLVTFWSEIVNKNPDSDNIDDGTRALDNAIEGLVRICQAIRNVTIFNGKMLQSQNRMEGDRIKLLKMLSRKRNKKFAEKSLGDQEFEDLVQSIFCESLGLDLIKKVLRKLTTVSDGTEFATQLITNPEDMTILIEIQTTLGEITQHVALVEKNFTELNRRALPNLGRHILDSYMNLVDNAVNMETVDIWAQMLPEEVNEKLHHLLLSNERYVGTVSELILGKTSHDENYLLEKDSLSVSISKVQLQENNEQNTSAEFKYENTLIKTDSMELLDIADGDDLRVYTLRYKSWSHMIRDILLKQSDLHTNNSTKSANHTRKKRTVDSSAHDILTNKSFIGKGGIVSLSTRQNGVKRSLPVTYWIGFDNETFDSYGASTCVSCEYLDPNTVTWESRGCYIKEVDSNGITCKCNHTTNFAAFMMPAEMIYKLPKDQTMILKILSMVGSFLSIFGLVITLTVFYLIRHMVRNERFKAHAHLSFALLAVHITFLMGDLLLSNNVVCVISTVVSHYFLLASFMWMLIEGIFLYLYVVQVFLRAKIASYNWMYLVGWGIPLIVLVISAGYGIPKDIYVMKNDGSVTIKNDTDLSPCPDGSIRHHFATKEKEEGPTYARCWLSTESGIIWSFLVPAMLVLAFNAGIMYKTLSICVQSLRNTRRMSSSVNRDNGKFLNASSPKKKSNQSREHSDSYNGLHGQVSTSTRPMLSASPCLLQVTTEEEENKKTQNESDQDGSSLSSGEHAVPQDASSPPMKPDDQKNYGVPSRYPSVSGDSPRICNSRASVMYRNSITNNSVRIAVTKPRTFGTKLTELSLERVKFIRDAKAAVKGAVILLPILGVSWILGFFTHLSPIILYLFILLNSTQGAAIFVVYCLCNAEVRRAMKRRSVVRNMKNSVDGGIRRTSSTSTARSFLRFGRRRSTVVTST